ncbi:MAG: cbb3-type cytochrome c oxidase subunit II [Xanthomonadaceae bacterium]|jgi:cytochrome c oxidase cbb3-type subunit 2|nr:cbb3-type cytochrome c oxidase subunit II [Xanthomonadaceae bacterium]
MTNNSNGTHEKLERNVGLMAIAVAVAVSFGGLAQIVPLMFQAETITPIEGAEPYSALELAGRDVYLREGCYTCHSQMIRTLRFETERYGHYSLAGESVFDHPFQWGSKRTGPDLARVGGRYYPSPVTDETGNQTTEWQWQYRYSDDWHREHLINPRNLVPESNMPAFTWLEHAPLKGSQIAKHMRALRRIGVPYTDEQIDAAPSELEGKTELDAVVAYLQGLGKYAPRGK